jgi:hypothetical protein
VPVASDISRVSVALAVVKPETVVLFFLPLDHPNP